MFNLPVLFKNNGFNELYEFLGSIFPSFLRTTDLTDYTDSWVPILALFKNNEFNELYEFHDMEYRGPQEFV